MQRSTPLGRGVRRVLIALVSSLLLTASLAIVPTPVGADGTETLGPPSIPIATGNGTVAAGVGLLDAQPGNIVLDVPTDVTVEQVLVYWEGHASSENAGFDDDIELDGNNVVGTLIGGPTLFFGSNWSSTYRADITNLGLVSPGLNTISVDDLNYDLRNNGAGILVITSDGGPASELTVRDGNDLAFIGFPSPRDATVPQTVTFTPAPADRVATINVFASSVAGQDPPGERPNYILVTVDAVVTQFDNVLASNDGEEWDTVTLSVDIPAGASSITVEVVSDDPADPDTGNLPASLAWNAAAINIPAVPNPEIIIEKATNGNDADGPNDTDVPRIAPGDPITWTYEVTNSGDVPFDIAEVVVSDDIVGAITNIVDQGDGDDTLAPGETWIYEAAGQALDLDVAPPPAGVVIVDGCGTVAKPGNRATYENVGSVTVPGDTDADPSHYCNPPDPGIDIEKATNGVDADDANDVDVPEIAPGDSVTWTYVVTNTGDVAFDISDVVVTDDIVGPVTDIVDQGDGDTTLSPGEVWVYEFIAPSGAQDLTSPDPGTVVVPGCNPGGGPIPGDRATYENIGSVTVPGDSDTDPSHYCNPPGDPGIDIEKLVNGNDADDPDGTDVPILTPGATVTFTYLVTNTGAVPFAEADVTVADDIPGVTPVLDPASDSGSDGVLSPNEVWSYTASSTVEDLQSPSAGTVVVQGCNPGGDPVPGERATYKNIGTVMVPGDSDADPGHYCNPPDPGIDIEKLTNGNQADGANDADVPVIAPGGSVTWTYVVTNTGDIAFDISEVAVSDDIVGAVTNIVDQGDGDDFLEPGETWVFQFVAPTGAENLQAPSAGTVVVQGCNPSGDPVPGERATYENIGSVVVPGDSDTDPSHYCNPPVDPPQGGEGCTPGYWKQRHHFDSWVGLSPGDDFESTFGVDASFDKTLLGALKQGGGKEKALGRHAVAALLNSMTDDVSFALTPAEVIAHVQDAYATGNFNEVKNLLAAENEQGCPLN